MKNFLFILILLTSVNACAQRNKFKNLAVTSYEIESDGNVKINSYSRISENGKLDVYINGSRGKAYYSYQLSENELNEIRKLTNGDLNDFVSKKNLDPNQGYAGSRNYLSFEKNRQMKSLCYILPFMNQEFTEISNLLESKIYAQKDSAKVSEFKIDYDKLEKSIKEQDKNYPYLPQKTLPPPPMMVK